MRHQRMPREQRAKQFMPFMPLVGYQDALREREHLVESSSELKHEQVEDGNSLDDADSSENGIDTIFRP